MVSAAPSDGWFYRQNMRKNIGRYGTHMKTYGKNKLNI
jgi:hypothetical protein